MEDLERSLRGTNLNLLPVLRAVLKHQNLTRAAEELHITQSGVSNSLKQLRAHFDDELLVREGRGLRLTDKAKQLVEPLERAMAAVEQVLTRTRFEPAASKRQFRMATADYVAAITAPEMAALMGHEAPHLTVQIVAARARSIQDLRSGNIDLIISPRQVVEAAIYSASDLGPNIAKDFTIEHLSREPFACLAREDDEAFERGLSVDDYLARPHASFHLDLDVHASLEHGYLVEHGVDQFNRILTSDFTVLPLIAARSDCIALAPLSLARLAARSLPLRVGPCPLPIPDLELVTVSLRQRHEEPELVWLRDLLKRCVAASLGS